MTQFRLDSLTCDAVLERLDALSFDWPPDEPLDAALRAAWEHAQTCAACAAQIEQRRESDIQIAANIQSVPIPAGFKERLLSQVLSQSTTSVAADPLQPQPLRESNDSASAKSVSLDRRAWWLTAAAALLVASSGSWLWIEWQSRGVSLQALYDQAPLDPTGLTPVRDLSALPPFPVNWARQKGLGTHKAHWFSPARKTAVAWVSFELQTAKHPKIRGVLLAVPRSRVIGPPPDWITNPPPVTYTKRNGSQVAVAGWTERDIVYVCLVPGDASQLERLLIRLGPSAV